MSAEVQAGPALASPVLTAADEHAAVEQLHQLGCTDGLPVVVPTPERVGRMVLASGLDADLSLGEIGPLGGAATVERVAACALMAGCLPDALPVVLAAVRALADPVLDVGEVQATTHSVGQLLVVNGPARQACGPVASGTGALGPGHRANTTIGRAVRLCLVNIGGGRPGVSDMALLGHPGKLTMCLAEAEEASPFPPLHTTRGFTADQSAVTVAHTEAPHSVICSVSDDAADTAERLLRQLAAAAASPASNNANIGRGEIVVLLNPEHAAALAAAGLDRAAVQARLADYAINPRHRLHGFAARADRSPDEPVPAVASADDLLVLVAGGGGMYSAVLPSWGAGPHANRSVTVPIDLEQACEVPW